MNTKEIKTFDAVIKAYGKKVASNKKTSKTMLVNIGVITDKGNVRKAFKQLCTAGDQD
jgi:hypothetical protein